MATVTAKSGEVEVTKPEISVTTVDNIQVTIALTRVTDADADHAGTNNLHPVIYGKLYEKTSDHTSQEFLAKGESGYDSFHSTPADGFAVTEGWHYAINSAAGDKLYWDAAANTYAAYDPATAGKENYAIYKVTWSSTYTSDQRVAFNAAHENGMRNVISFGVKEGADASTTIWTNADNPGNYTSAPGTNSSFNLDVTSLTGTSANGTLGYVMVYCLGTSVTATVTVGVTATPGGWNDIGA